MKKVCVVLHWVDYDEVEVWDVFSNKNIAENSVHEYLMRHLQKYNHEIQAGIKDKKYFPGFEFHEKDVLV